MLELDIRSNGAQVIARLHNFRATNIPRAMKNAANATGRYVHAALRSEMTQVFDRPTPWTLGGLKFKLATEDKPLVRIWLEEFGDKARPVARYLSPQIQGGAREEKRMEMWLRQSGWLPPGWFAVPAREAPRDAYGNVPRSFVVRMLSDLRSFTGDAAYLNRKAGRRKGRKTTNAFFAVRAGGPKRTAHLRPGVYWRLPNRMLVCVFVFVSRATYRKRFDFYGVGRRAYDRVSMRFLQQEIERPGSTRSPRTGRA